MKTETSGLSLFQLLWNPRPGSKERRLLLNPLGEMGAGEGEGPWYFGRVEGLVPGLSGAKVSTLGTLHCSFTFRQPGRLPARPKQPER